MRPGRGYKVTCDNERRDKDGTLWVDFSVSVARWRIALEYAKGILRGDVRPRIVRSR